MDTKPRKFVFFINPLARDGALGRQWQEIEQHFESQLPRTEFLMPTSADQCREWVAEAARQDGVCLVAVGGEGSMNNVANGILDVRRERDVPMGLVPYGNVNDYAMAIGMHRNWQHALETLEAGNEANVGVTELVTLDRSSYALNLATIGFTASTAEQHSVKHQLSWLKGQLKYNVLALKMLLKWKNIPCRITLDNDAINCDLSILIVGFSPTLAAFRIVPHATPFADQMAVTLGINLSKLALLTRLQQVKNRPIDEDQYVLYRQASKIVVEAETPFTCEVDGEIVATNSYKVEFHAHPGRIRFIVPVNAVKNNIGDK
ncbi:MAG: diacylglycerol kinase family protein [Acidiferrobacterales bacterium]